MNNVVRYTLICLFSLIVTGASAQESTKQREQFDSRFLMQFPNGVATIDPQYKDNYYAIEELKRFFATIDMNDVDSIAIVGSASPDGTIRRNHALALGRANALKDLIIMNFTAPKDVFQIDVKGDTWPEALNLIKRDENFPDKSHTLIVLTTDVPYKDRMQSLKFMEYRESYDYVRKVIFPALRHAMAVVISYKSNSEFVVYDNLKDFEQRLNFIQRPDETPELLKIAAVGVGVTDTVVEQPYFAPIIVRQTRPLFAIKTNLLYDAVAALNIELEIPLGKRWSILGEVIVPWWLSSQKQIAMQVFSAHIEGRYWFGNRDKVAQMTGWFGGVYAGGGYYDLEWKTKGYQGESVISAGITGGYAHTVNKSGTLRMEYSLGLGYLYTHYREYIPQHGADGALTLELLGHGQRSWIGPTKAKVSLVWMLNSQKKVKANKFNPSIK